MTSATPASVDADALLCALVLAPNTFSRNRFYEMFEAPTLKKVRRRAKRVRGVVRQLLGQGREPAEVVGQRDLEDGRVLLRYRIQSLSFERTIALSALEFATLNYALSRAGHLSLQGGDRDRVESALERLAGDLLVESE